MSGKALDYGQVKVIVLGKAVAQNPEKMEKLLKEIKENLKMDGSGEEIRIPKLFVYDKKPRILR